MSITNPGQLVDEFKKSGEFDRLRRELLSQFQQSEGISAFKSRIEDNARQHLTSDQKLRFLPQEMVHRELMQEMDRYPVVERAVAEMHTLSDPAFAANIQSLLEEILRDGKVQKLHIRKDHEKEDSLVKPGTIHTPNYSEFVQQDNALPPSEATPPILSLGVTTVNPPPLIPDVLENPPGHTPEDGSERGKIDIAAVVPHEPPILTLTTADGGYMVDVEMTDVSQPNGRLNASSS